MNSAKDRFRECWEPEAWLEIKGEVHEKKRVACPLKAHDVPLRTCLGCSRYHSLTIDPAGHHVYIDCAWGAV